MGCVKNMDIEQYHKNDLKDKLLEQVKVLIKALG